jgi:hypothetical protein
MANTQKTKQILENVKQTVMNKAWLVKSVKRIDPKVAILLAIPVLVVLFIITTIFSILSRSATNSSAQTGSSVNIIAPSGFAQVNKEFTFGLKDSTDKTIGSFSYTIQNAELDKQIIIQGNRATAIAGRIFLIVNLKLTNTQDKGLSVNTRNYIRLLVNGSSELLAPEIHNDPVEVQAISTKYTRVGFAINVSDKDYILKVGEIDGKKTDIKLLFTK